MTTKAFDRLVCPCCAASLDVEVFRDGAEGPEEALLRSPCGLWFPVVDSIPRIFVGQMRRIYATDFADFLARHHLSAGPGENANADAATAAKLATRESFGYEWTHFHEMLPEWEENARYYFEPLGGVETLQNRVILDGGCGKGRHAYYALRAGAEVVAVDFSRAIDVARDNCREVRQRALFVQADLTALPFRAASFDVAYSFGVLHHLPDPEAGFARLLSLVKPRGWILIYLYHALEDQPLKQAVLRAVTAARQITTRLPHSVLMPLTNALGYALYGGVVLPYRALARIPWTRGFAESLPLKSYARYPVRVIVNDQFDRFSAPIENRYRKADVEGWLDRAALDQRVILGGGGWRAAGQTRA